MSEQAKGKGSIGIYHVMLREIDKRNIFLDDEDRMKFIEGKGRQMKRPPVFHPCLPLVFSGQV